MSACDNYNPMKDHIFKNKSKNIGYYDYATANLHCITHKNINSYNVFSNRGILSAIIAGTAYLALNSLIATAGIYVLSIFVFELVFRKVFLPSCETKKNQDIKQLIPCKVSGEPSDPANKILFRVVLLIALGVLIVLNAYDQELMGLLMSLSWVVGVICEYLAITQVIQLYVQSKRNVKRS